MRYFQSTLQKSLLMALLTGWLLSASTMAKAETVPSTEIAATKTTPVETTLAAAPNKFIELPKFVMVFLGLSILIVPILIFALLWLLLSKRQHTDVMQEIRTGISLIDDRLTYGQKQEKRQQLEMWQELGDFLNNQTTEQQEQLEAIRQQIIFAQNPFQANLNRQEAQLIEQVSTSIPPTMPLQPEPAPTETQNEPESLAQPHQDAQPQQTAVATAQTELQTVTEKTLQNLLHGRFRLVKPKGTDFSDWTTALIEQQGTWRWAQPALLAELLACETQVNRIKKQGDEKAQNILALLALDNLLKHWNTLVAQRFDSDTELWQHLNRLDNGKWLHRLLRASDLLQTYFKQEQPLHLLTQHLSNVAGILQALFSEIGVQLLKPQLLEKVPDDVPEKYYIYQPHPILKQLVKPQVLEKLKTVPKFVVDIERYGFVTDDTPKADIRVFVSSPAEWEA
jgi:hypothetical protein